MTTENGGSDRAACLEGSVLDACCSASAVADLVADRFVLIDERLKLVYANPAFRAAHGPAAGTTVIGDSLGAALKCRHAAARQTCGTAEACLTCGWFQAVQACRARGSGKQDCRILTAHGEAVDFAVTVHPVRVTVPGGAAWACSLTDAYAQKRLRVLEKVFFHDVTNLAIALRGITELLNESGEDIQSLHEMLHASACKLVDSVDRLRTLRTAESGDLRVWYSPQAPDALMQAVANRYQEETAARCLKIAVEQRQQGFPFETDQELFLLVLGELLLNAVEASSRGEQVTLGYSADGGRAVFYVRNPAVLEPYVRAHVFERSFTTKGAGRGVGTYLAKLIAERYLKGTVWFTSQEPEGTTFYVSYPASVSGSRS